MKQPSEKGRSLPRRTLRIGTAKQDEVMVWARENHAESFSSAVRRLIDHGLTATKRKAPKPR
jgi:hypothetical protein